MSRRNPWAFKIDYVAAIRDDEREVAQLSAQITHGWYQVEITTPRGSWTAHDLYQLVLYVPGIAARMGLTPQDVADYADWCEIDDALLDAAHPSLPSPRPGRESRVRANEIDKRLAEHRILRRNEDDARVALRKAKARLARHKRNQLNYGASKP